MAQQRNSFYSSVYRPFRQASVSLTLAARSAGHYRVPPGWRDTAMEKHFVELFWCIDGTGCFVIDGADFLLPPGHVCCYFPGDVHIITAVNWWEYRWMTFDGDSAGDIIRNMNLSREPVEAGSCPAELFIRLEDSLRDFSPAGQCRASAAGYAILCDAAAGKSTDGKTGISAEFRSLVLKKFAEPAMDVAAFAESLGVHRSTLNRVFKRDTGMTPGEYLHSFRIQEALSLLKGTALSMTEIAEKTGFPDRNYFTKVIRGATGMTPREFRRS